MVLLPAILVTVNDMAAQIHTGFSQYLTNGMVINPAYAGSRGTLSTMLSLRAQWSRVPGAPRFQGVSAHAPMKNDRVSLGLLYSRLSYGITDIQNIYGVYAYRVAVGKSRLSFGLQAGADIKNSNYAGVNTTMPNDPAFIESVSHCILPNVGAGAYFYNEYLFLGLSVPSFLSYRESGGNGSLTVFHSAQNYDILFLAGGHIPFSEGFGFKPSALLKYSPSKPVEIDISGNFIIADALWLGASYRLAEQSLIGILEMQISQQLKIGYSYDYQMGYIGSFSRGSHEVLIRYEFGYKVSAATPRYF